MRLPRVLVTAALLALPAAAFADMGPGPINHCTLEAHAEPGLTCMICEVGAGSTAWCNDPAQSQGFARKCSEPVGSTVREVWCSRNEGSQAPVESPPIIRVVEPGESDGSAERAAAAAASAAAAAGSGEAAAASGPTLTAAPEGTPAPAEAPDTRGCAAAPAVSLLPVMAALGVLGFRRRRSA